MLKGAYSLPWSQPWHILPLTQSCYSNYALTRLDMSYRRGAAGSGHGQRRGRRGGPNRGRGRGMSGRSDDGEGMERRRPPPGLRGREIGMYYARQSRAKKKAMDRNSRAVINIDRTSERNITQILSDVRQQTGTEGGQAVDTDRRGSSEFDHQYSEREEWAGQEATRHRHSRTNFPGGQSDRSHFAMRNPQGPSVSDWQDSVDFAGSSSSEATGTSSYSVAEDCQWSTLEESRGKGPPELQDWESTDYSDTSGPSSSEIATDDVAGSFRIDTKMDTNFEMAAGSSLLSDRSVASSGGLSLVSSVEMDRKLMDDLFEARNNNKKYKEMLEFRTRLPSWKARNDILKLVKNSKVCVISGGTGCGKTTQVPQFIIDDAIFSEWGSRCHVICTQPRRISAIAVSQRVAAERGEPHGVSSGYQIRLENKLPRSCGSVLYCTTGVLLRRLITDPNLAEASHVIMDEVHERNISSDFLIVIMKDLLIRRPDLKLILMSATINAEMFSAYFDKAPIYTIQNVVFPVTEYFLEDILAKTNYLPPPAKLRKTNYGGFNKREQARKDQEEAEAKEKYILELEARRMYSGRVIDSLRNHDETQIDLELIMEVIKHICSSMGEGAILIFLPGWDTISKLHDMLKASPVYRSSRNYLVIPLHSLMPTSTQQSVFDRPPPGVRKIIIATNIAETSITIDDVVFVIDCGKVKETTYDPNNQMACLEAVWVSKAAARQRQGRAGRVQEGHCFHLFTHHRHGNMEEFQKPEILRTPLEELILQIKILRLGQVVPFLDRAIESPDGGTVKVALKCLRDLNALTADEELTPLGRHLANLPVHPRIGKIILFGAIFSCLDPVLTIASSMGFKEPFVIPLNKQKEADEVKKKFAEDSHSDHIALLNAFRGWERAKQLGDARQYCWDKFLANNTLELLRNMKVQFAGLLQNIGFTSSCSPTDPASNYNSDKVKLVKAVLCAGLYPNVIHLSPKKPSSTPKLFTRDGKVAFHPKSVNYEERDFDSRYMIYHTKMKSTSVFVHDSSTIPPLPLLFFGGNISAQRDEDQETISVDGWIVFQAARRTAELVQDMRHELDLVLDQKVANPRMALYEPAQRSGSPVSQLIQAIIDLITKEDYSHQMSRLASGKHLYSRGK